jgi:RNA recognition motif-containing protein
MKIQVGNVPVSSTEADLWRAFERCGAVASVTIVTSRATGSRLGFAFVEMEDEVEAQEAILSLDGSDLGGRSITVKQAPNGLPVSPPRGP